MRWCGYLSVIAHSTMRKITARNRGQIAGNPEAIRMSGVAAYAELGQTGVDGNYSLPALRHSSIPRLTHLARFMVEVPPLASAPWN